MEVNSSAKTKLSAQQTDIYLDQIIHKDLPLYNIGGYVEFVGDLNIEALLQAHRLMVNNAEAFSVRLDIQNDTLSMVCDAQPGEARIDDVSASAEPVIAARHIINELYKTNFQLDGTLYVSGLIKLTDTRFWYYGIAHHLIMDGWGFSNWVQSLCKLYNAVVKDLPPLVDFPSFVGLIENENSYFESERVNKDREFWLDTFSSLPKLILQAQEKRRLKPEEQVRSERVSTSLDYKKLEEHKAFATTLGVSVVQLYLGALYVYFSRIHDQQELVFSIPVHNRRTSGAKKTIGTALSVYPTQLSAGSDCSVSELITLISKRQKLEFRHQRYPIGRLHQDLELRKHTQPRLFDISFNYQKLDYEVSVVGLETATYFLTNGYEQIPLTFTLCDFGSHQPAELQIDYNLSYFNKAKAEAMLKRWSHIIEQMVATPDGKIADIQLISPWEMAQFKQINATEKCWPVDHFITKFEQQAQCFPSNIALCFAEQTYSYEQLNRQVNQYTRYLREKGIKPGDMVGICLPRQAELVVVLLAVMKLGATYVPMDPGFPVSRLALMLEHSEQTALITSELQARKFKQLSLNTHLPDMVTLQQLQNETSHLSGENPAIELNGELRAYVLFTSGSTGIPKGVAVGHSALLNFLMTMAEKPGFDATDRLLAVTTISFDIAGLELYLPLLCGGTLVLADSDMVRDGRQLLAALSRHSITVMQGTPATWQLLVEAGWPSQQSLKVLCGGEALPGGLAEQLTERSGQVWNMYGPTETTIWSTISQVVDKCNINIGKPIGNTQVYLLDDELKQVPYGEKGRLFIGGSGVAQGYINNSEQTQSRFITWCGSEAQPVQIYDTGDFASFGADGDLYYHGRSDNQIKFRGYRIELGDIETALNSFEGIEDSLANIQDSGARGSDNQFIAAYFVASTRIDTEALKSYLISQLPGYMVPLVYVTLDAFPLTPNGKKDRKALKPATRPQQKVTTSGQPDSEIEQIIVSVWQDILSLEHISVEQNLFEIGASSLDVVRAGKKLEERLGRPLDTINLFEHSTIRALARYLSMNNSIKRSDTPIADTQKPDNSEQIQAGKDRMMQRRARRTNE
jgi:amino acid adenylation domain-containing protein